MDQQGFQGKSQRKLRGVQQDGAHENARKIGAGRARLGETAEISKLARGDEPPQV